MKSRKRVWSTEASKNPFDLPRSIATKLKSSVTDHAGHEHKPPEVIKYLWIYVSEDGLRQSCRTAKPQSTLDTDGWLNIIDESAALGARFVVVNVGSSLAQYPDVWRICQWAQNTHGMTVGLYLYKNPPRPSDLEQLAKLDPAKTCIFVDSDDMEIMRPVKDLGLKLCAADVTCDDTLISPEDLERMVCVGSEGQMYTCGLVLGDQDYCFGNATAELLARKVSDGSRRLVDPTTVPKPKGACNACPPMMAKRMAQRMR